MANHSLIIDKPSTPKKKQISGNSNTTSIPPPKSILLAHIAAASIHVPTVATLVDDNGIIMPMYIPGPFPIIHTSHPMAPLDYIKLEQVAKWEAITSAKILAIPFNMDLDDSATHSLVTNCTLQVICDITQEELASVAAPIQSTEAMRTHAQPTAFLIFNISQDTMIKLIEHQVWSSEHVTFQAISLNIGILLLLFVLAGFMTNKTDLVLCTMITYWTTPKIMEFFDNLIANSWSTDTPLFEETVIVFLDSLKIK